MLRRVLSGYWRKETEKSKVFCGVVGLDGRCSAQAEQRKKPVAVGPLPGAYMSTETNLVPIRGVMRKEFETGHTRRHARTHTHTRNKYMILFLLECHVRTSAGDLAVHGAFIPCVCVCVCPVSNSFFITPRIGTRFVSVDR